MKVEILFKKYLRSNNLKFTPERREILNEIRKIKTHFEVEDIIYRFHRDNKEISRASIYRTLPLLVDSGIVRKTPCDSMKARYEFIFGHEHHDHMVCIKCGQIIEFKNDYIERLQKQVAESYNFRMIAHKLIISGICENCK